MSSTGFINAVTIRTAVASSESTDTGTDFVEFLKSTAYLGALTLIIIICINAVIAHTATLKETPLSRYSLPAATAVIPACAAAFTACAAASACCSLSVIIGTATAPSTESTANTAIAVRLPASLLLARVTAPPV